MSKNFLTLLLCLGTALIINAVNEDRVEEAPPPPSEQLKPTILRTLRLDATPTNCHPGDVDLVFVVDGSGSIGSQNFETVKGFLKNIVTGLNIDSTSSRVSVIQFTTSARLEFKLNQYSTTTDINNAIEHINYISGGTYIASGMNLAVTQAFTLANGDRPDVDNVMLVLTDGQDGRIQDVLDAYNAAHDKGDTVLAVGVGNGVNRQELNAIAGNNLDNVFDVSSFNNLSLIQKSICEHIPTDPCTPDPCHRHGSCAKVNGKDQDFKCTCDPGYNGDNCENSVCEHDGTFSCKCAFGYTGPTCGDIIDFCNGTQILHDGSQTQVPFCGPHGVCQNTPNGAACKCDEDWTGVFCDQNIDDCQPNPCHNGGTCVDFNPEPGYKCECDRLHEGPTCDDNVDFCKDLEILQNGTVTHVHVCGDHGICKTTPGGALCICENSAFADYTGKFCEVEIPKSCTWNGNTYPHNSTWVHKCDSCACIFGVVECADAYWCPQQCALYNTTKVITAKISTTCPKNMNCIPDKVACAKPVCDYPIGWCFPVGMVMVDTVTFPTNPPRGYKQG